MNKEELSKIPIEEAKKEHINLAKRIEDEKYLVSATITKVDNEKVLIMYFYSSSDLIKEKTKAVYRVFMNKEDYITQDFEGDKSKWKTASIRNLLSMWRWQNFCVCADKQSEHAISSFIKCGKTVFSGLEDYQNNIMLKRLEKRHKKITDKIDKQMELVPELPEDFNKWIEETVLFKSRYIYYEYKARKKYMKGFCTYCKKDLLVEKPRHNQEGICPKCQSLITYKALGKSTKVCDYAEAALFQNVKTGFLIRLFKVSREFDVHYRKPRTHYFEVARDFYNGNGVKSYEWADFKQSGTVRWCDYNGKWCTNKTAVYDGNLEAVLKGTKWQYSALKEFATHKPGIGFDVYRYLSLYKEYPFIEYLVKLKLYKITFEIIEGWGANKIDTKGKTLEEILKINKAHLPMIQKMDASLDELRLVQVMQREGLNLPPERIRYINENFGCATGLLEIARYTTVNKALNYLAVQKEVPDEDPGCPHYSWRTDDSRKNKRLANTFNDWMDYIGFCKELEYDLNNEFVLYPKHLQKEHDRAYKLIQAKRDKEKAQKQKEMRDKIKIIAKEILKKYCMQYKGFVIMAPKNADELIKEGQILHHCVGSYLEKMAKGLTIILFIRKAEAPEKPYCTMEVTNGKVIQCRGKNNSDMTEKLSKVLDAFKKKKLIPQQEKKAM